MLFITTLILSGLYLILTDYIHKGLNKLKHIKYTDKISSEFITVIIPFRNEIRHLKNLIHSLAEQKYDSNMFEVILVDDHSDDGGNDYVRENLNKYGFLKLITLEKDEQFKKTAISKAVEASKGNLIVCTDADSHHGKNWLSVISTCFEIEKPAMIIGPLKISRSGKFLDLFQQLEFLSLQLVTAGFAGNNNAILCNGANLAFDKKIFKQLDGYNDLPDVASGDDFFLLLKMRKQKNLKISFVYVQEAITTVQPENTLRDFINQRVRWASKSRYAHNAGIYATGLLISSMTIWMILLPVLELNRSSFPQLTLMFLLVKLSADFLLLKKVRSFYAIKFDFSEFLLVFITYPFYICSVFFLSLFYKPKWKGREI